MVSICHSLIFSFSSIDRATKYREFSPNMSNQLRLTLHFLLYHDSKNLCVCASSIKLHIFNIIDERGNRQHALGAG